MPSLLRTLSAGCLVLGLVAMQNPARASELCDVQYFLPVTLGASWTFAREAQPRTIENIQPDGFEVHFAFATEYQGQSDVIEHVDTYRCGPEGLSLVRHSEIDQGAQIGQFGALYQGVALPRTIRPGLEWAYTYVLAGGDPTQPETTA
jgi:hypothetical protein